jgi:hypothetical protein
MWSCAGLEINAPDPEEPQLHITGEAYACCTDTLY